MTLDTHEFMRRFLLHVLPRGFHRIRHYGLLADLHPQGQHRPRPRALGRIASSGTCRTGGTGQRSALPCPCCGERMRIIETFGR